jgi:hypothetical protein
MYPAGSAIGVASDAIKFLSALMPADDETSPLFRDNATLNEMLGASLFFPDSRVPRFSHGFLAHFGAVRAMGHGGNTMGFSALFTIAPEERLGTVVMTNQAGETAVSMGLTRALFGGFTPPETTAEFADARELAGRYISARRPKRGFVSFVMAMGVKRVKAIDENTLDISGSTFVQVSPYVFLNTGGNEQMNGFDYFFFETKDGAVSRASMVYFDMLPISTGRVIVNVGSGILLSLCMLYALVALVILPIRFFRNRKKGVTANPAKKWNRILCLSLAAVVFNNVFLAVRMLSFVTYSSMLVHFIINIAFAIFVPIGVAILWRSRQAEPSKAGRVFNMFTVVVAVVLAVILVVWEFWR